MEQKPKKKGVALRELYWKTLVLGSHFPDDFNGGRFKSVPGDKYPIDIVLGLDKIANIYKVVIDVDDELIPSKISIRVGRNDSQSEVNYKNARLAHFHKPIIMEYYKRERSMSRMESKTAFADSIGQYVWINVGQPVEHKRNPYRVIDIKKLTILGYPLPVEEPTIDGEMVDETSSKKKIKEEPEFRVPKKDIKVERYSYEGDGMTMNEQAPLGGDPLTSVRTIRRVLERKMGQSEEEDKTVQATICLRAIQRIDEYEKRIEDLATRRSKALEAGDIPLAERHRLAMIDCRDTVFRAVHVDLLLDRNELRSIGVESDWADYSEEKFQRDRSESSSIN